MSSTVIKTWNAAAFQTGFEEVTVKLTLQSREKGSRREHRGMIPILR